RVSLGGAGGQRRGTLYPDCLGGLEVDDQFVFRRCLHRQVGRLLALEDAIDVAGRASVWLDRIGPVRDQTAGGGEVPLRIHCRQLVPGCQRDDKRPVQDRDAIERHDQAAVRTARKFTEGALEVAGILHVERGQFHSEGGRHTPLG